MRLKPSLLRLGTHFCLGCVGRLLLWTLWLGLGVSFGLGLWIALTPRVELPAPVLRHLERRLSGNGILVRLGGLSYSTSNQLAVRDLRLYIDGIESPLLSIENAFTTIDPWAFLAGLPGAHQLEFSGASLVLPAQLSPTGTALPFLDRIDACLAYGDHRLDILRLNARCAGLALHCEGSLDDHALRGSASAPTPSLGPRLVAAFRQAADLYPRLKSLGNGWLRISLTPSERSLALARLEAGLDSLDLRAGDHGLPPSPALPLSASRLLLDCSPLPLLPRGPAPLVVRLEADSLATPLFTALRPSVRLESAFTPGPRPALSAPSLGVSAASVSNKWIPIDGLAADLSLPAPGPGASAEPVHASAALTVAGGFTSLQASARPAQGSATLAVRTELGNGLVEAAGRLLGIDLLRFCSFRGRGVFDGSVSLPSDWRLASASGWVEAGSLDLYGVACTDISGRLAFDGRHFAATQARLTTADNFAEGSYEMDVLNRDFRFLLDGRLRPAHITPWFKGWWGPFWEAFDFSHAAPRANVDVSGRWGAGNHISVFVGADVRHPTLRGVPLHRARTRIFIRPQWIHALALEAWRPEGYAEGWFSRGYNPAKAQWTRVDFAAQGALDPVACSPMLGESLAQVFSNFVFSQAPSTRIEGWLNGPGSPSGPGQSVRFEVASTGGFQLFRFPLEDLCFQGLWEGPEIRIPSLQAKAAGGSLTGSARFDVGEKDRGIDIKAQLTDARLGAALDDVEAHLALLNQQPYTKDPDRLRNLLLSLSAEASGRYDDPLSFHGKGSALVAGDELARVRLLGGLSKLLSFTSLRFTNAKARFSVAGPVVDFPSIRIVGKNSAIDGHGSFQLDNRALGFNAKVWPFDETSGLIQGALGLVLAPLSHAFEVKLSGNLANPEWRFVNNPFRAPAEAAPTPAADGSAPPPAPTETP